MWRITRRDKNICLVSLKSDDTVRLREFELSVFLSLQQLASRMFEAQPRSPESPPSPKSR